MQKNVFRKCIGCGELKSRDNLIKITKDFLSGNIILNPNSKIFGRSAYLCYNQSCINTALKKSKINKALKTNAKFEKEDFEKLNLKG